jgi:hypothetical protein
MKDDGSDAERTARTQRDERFDSPHLISEGRRQLIG